MKFTKLFFLFLTAATLSFAGCGEDEVDPNVETNNRLDGEWEVESFLAIGGVGSSELMGNSFSAIELDFEKQGPMDGEYSFTFIATAANGGATSVIRGDYEIENIGTEITLMPDNGDPDEEYDIEIDGDDLELDGLFTFDNGAVRAQIKAERD